MTYKLLRHKDFTAEWEKLPVAIRDQFKKKLAKVIEQPHIPKKNMLRGDLAGCYKIKLLKAGVRLVYQVKDDQVVILLITVGKRADSIVYDEAKKRIKD
jgi:mRNA interferase RelE/StbE